MNRREHLQSLKSIGLLSLLPNWVQNERPLLQRAIPSSGEKITSVGMGTWRTFDVDESEKQRNPLKRVLENLVANAGKVVDSSPMYGNSERVVGDLSKELKMSSKLFITTKVWTTGEDAGIHQMNRSFQLLQRKQIDLMQVHNLVDWQTHLRTLRRWKEEGKIKYIGITHYLDAMHDTMEEIMLKIKPDFIQVNYNMSDRHAEERLLRVAHDQGVGVIINRPFQEGDLFNQIKGKKLPAWATEFDCHHWSQFFLKYVLSNPAVTCAIPATTNPQHMIENIGAAYGNLPTEKQRKEMVTLWES